ncbi:proline--tRNA ligase [Aliicoccus persicus]|uniref:Proline--tRNA ligase n=1 Tax=Aliicoccus persicus TaxID=930138 RepID=A0A662Z2A8_9STAP|nr:proline--tRNA ligase [Aliicoccus persicus]SEV81830.1 prolyl-tRNA synthetase [Aliicoccus persicus]
MRQTNLFIPTRRETPSDAVSISHQIMLRAGLISQVAAGIYNYLPLARRSLLKIENIVRTEMNNIGSAEVMMPVLSPKELWEQSGRWQAYGDELMRFTDRHDNGFALGPTHEEVVVDMLKGELKSYKKLPLTIYQIQTKFRDERRPRFGLLRGREFIMKDAYSFHIDDASLDKTYNDMKSAYMKILDGLNLDYRAVEADSGSIGGKDSEEFMVLSDIGEDIVVYTEESDYSANIEKAACLPVDQDRAAHKPLEKVETPNVASCESLAEFLSIDLKQTTKTMIADVDGEFKMFIIRGDQELNDTKIKSYFDASIVELAEKESVAELMGAKPGSLGPVDTKLEVYVDYQVAGMSNYPVGANIDDYHFLNVNEGRDFTAAGIGDFRFINEGEMVEDGSGKAKFMKGIELGHIFKLGTLYSESMDFTVLDENGRSQFVKMGCYGFGVSRALSAVIEAHHDDDGIIWPKSVAPFDIHLVTASMKDEGMVDASESLYETLSKSYEVLYDDRDERAGVKFKDSDLIGMPVRVVVGRGIADGNVEVKFRNQTDKVEVPLTELTQYLAENL